jgi:hypothetical protein
MLELRPPTAFAAPTDHRQGIQIEFGQFNFQQFNPPGFSLGELNRNNARSTGRRIRNVKNLYVSKYHIWLRRKKRERGFRLLGT